MAAFLDVCRFTPTAGGTTDWTVSAAVTGYQTPAGAGAVNATVYRYRAENADLSQWEVGYGPYTSAGTVLARTTVLFNSSGTAAKINFTATPQVAVVALKEDLISVEEANSFTSAQQAQAALNIGIKAMTVTLKTSGSGTYTTPAGCTRIRVRLVGGGGGANGTGTSPGTGGTGGNTTFSTLTGSGGSASTGGAATGGNIANIAGGNSSLLSAGITNTGSPGINSIFGGAGGVSFNAAGSAGATNSGSGGGGGWFSGTGNSNAGGAAAGYVEHQITSPAATYSYAVGAGGTSGSAGTSGFAGGAGGSGQIIIEEYYGA